MQTARAWGAKPLEILAENGNPRNASWVNPRNRALAKALTIYERSTCDGCGHPVSQTHDPDYEGWFEAEVIICAGCKARDQAGKDGAEPGARIRVSLDPAYEKRS